SRAREGTEGGTTCCVACFGAACATAEDAARLTPRSHPIRAMRGIGRRLCAGPSCTNKKPAPTASSQPRLAQVVEHAWCDCMLVGAHSQQESTTERRKSGRRAARSGQSLSEGGRKRRRKRVPGRPDASAAGHTQSFGQYRRPHPARGGGNQVGQRLPSATHRADS